ncbi:hypothetical protein BC827DRAFT_129002 [Russula dissimulans]|nr:hypothetical protein BC827DRAFT_129002 [Russula dissimulans]
MPHRPTYQALISPPQHPMQRRLLLAAMQAPQPGQIRRGVIRQRDQTPLLGPSKYQGESEAAPPLRSPSGMQPLPHVGTCACVIDKAQPLPLPPVVLRAQSWKPRMVLTATLMDPAQEATDNSPERPQTSPLTCCAVAIVSDIRADAGQSLELDSDAHILINSDADVQGDGVEDGIVALEPNDDFAVSAPPGALGTVGH